MNALMRFTFLLFLCCLLPGRAGAADDSVWKALRAGGHVIFIRHAVTEPGIGDPDGFMLDNCRTQRNLSVRGQADARAIGEAFRNRHIPVAEVLSSRWCRCLDTARLAFGEARPAAMLDSIFNAGEPAAAEKTRAVHAYAGQSVARANLVFVTHAQNIQALTGISPAAGEIIITKYQAGTFRVVDQINLPR